MSTLENLQSQLDREIAATIEPLRAKLAEMETLQADYRRRAKALDDPIAKLRRVLNASKGGSSKGAPRAPHGPRRPASGDRLDPTGQISNARLEEIASWLRKNSEQVNRNGGYSAGDIVKNLGEPISDQSARKALTILEERGDLHVAGKRPSPTGKGAGATVYKVSETNGGERE